MERTKTDQVDTSFFERNIITHHFLYTGGLKYAVNVFLLDQGVKIRKANLRKNEGFPQNYFPERRAMARMLSSLLGFSFNDLR